MYLTVCTPYICAIHLVDIFPVFTTDFLLWNPNYFSFSFFHGTLFTYCKYVTNVSFTLSQLHRIITSTTLHLRAISTKQAYNQHYLHLYYQIQCRCVGTISQYCFSSDLHLVTFDEAHLQPQWLTVCADSVDVLLGDEADRAPGGMQWILTFKFYASCFMCAV